MPIVNGFWVEPTPAVYVPPPEDEGGSGSITVTGSNSGEVAAVTSLVLAGTVSENSPGVALQEIDQLTGDLDASGFDIDDVGVLTAATLVMTAGDDPGDTGSLYSDDSDINALAIGDPETATTEDIATAFNALITALSGFVRVTNGPG